MFFYFHIVDLLFLLILIYLSHNVLKNRNIAYFDVPNNEPIKEQLEENNFLMFSDKYIDFESFDNKIPENDFIVPNIYHLAITNSKELTNDQYLSILSVVHYQKPSLIFLHYLDADSLKGKYWQKLIDHQFGSLIQTNKVKLKNRIFEQAIKVEKHSFDILKLEILMFYGGIFIDENVYLVESLEKYRRFEMVVFQFNSSSMRTDLMIANRNARFIRTCFDSYRYNYKPNDLFYNSLAYPQEILNKFGYMAKRVNTVSVDTVDLAKEKNEDKIAFIKNKQTFFDYFKKQFQINDV